MNLRQIDWEIRKLQLLRKEHISVLFEIDNSFVSELSKSNIAKTIAFVKTLNIDDDELMQEIESFLYKIKGRI